MIAPKHCLLDLLEKNNSKWIEICFYWGAQTKTQKILVTPLSLTSHTPFISGSCSRHLHNTYVIWESGQISSVLHYHLVHVTSVSHLHYSSGFLNTTSLLPALQSEWSGKKASQIKPLLLLNISVNECPTALRVNSKLHTGIYQDGTSGFSIHLGPHLIILSTGLLYLSPHGLLFPSFSTQNSFWPQGRGFLSAVPKSSPLRSYKASFLFIIQVSECIHVFNL